MPAFCKAVAAFVAASLAVAAYDAAALAASEAAVLTTGVLGEGSIEIDPLLSTEMLLVLTETAILDVAVAPEPVTVATVKILLPSD